MDSATNQRTATKKTPDSAAHGKRYSRHLACGSLLKIRSYLQTCSEEIIYIAVINIYNAWRMMAGAIELALRGQAPFKPCSFIFRYHQYFRDALDGFANAIGRQAFLALPRTSTDNLLSKNDTLWKLLLTFIAPNITRSIREVTPCKRKMSGIEVAGLVLGAIPILVSALEAFIKGVSTIKKLMRYKTELKNLLRALITEYDIFRNSCEELLEGLAPASRIAQLLQCPGGEAWKEPPIERKLKDRLQRSYFGYLQTVDDMNDAIEEFKRRLKLGKDGQVRCFKRSEVCGIYG
ncbi:hypothetical protein CIHG_06972 [Coccidioides immitis H538.4]|uniref:Fungal STAND N-terminal Goodbye domain-containing protein n=1 Tax=Coccidioides immitis H538.4 TaxID=396776 RepID=A0A0J8RVW2_COCIT|nr:hypothetical protein CIHG_06972 [Coccidioides immitis H538.4]